MTNQPSTKPGPPGARTITLRPRTDSGTNGNVNPGYALFIGRALWREIGQPERLTLYREHDTIVLAQISIAGGYRVVGIGCGGQPRIRISRLTIDAIRLAPGVYPADVIDNQIRFAVTTSIT